MRGIPAGLAVALLGVTAPAMQRGDDAVSKTALVREDIDEINVQARSADEISNGCSSAGAGGAHSRLILGAP